MRSEILPDGRVWYRIAEAGWIDPLDPTFAAVVGGRWNPPGSHPTLYLNEDRITARLNLRGFIAGWPYDPEDLVDETGPVLVHATLPARQRVAEVHSQQGVAAVNLPPTYPLDAGGRVVERAVCQPIGLAAKRAGLRGVRARSARAPEGGSRELAWFPATRGSTARVRMIQSFEAWYWGGQEAAPHRFVALQDSQSESHEELVPKRPSAETPPATPWLSSRVYSVQAPNPAWGTRVRVSRPQPEPRDSRCGARSSWSQSTAD